MNTKLKNSASLSSTLTIRVNQKMKEQLEVVAQNQQRSKSFVASEAIASYLALQEWQDARVRSAIDAADRGEGISTDEMLSWVATLK